MAQALGIGGVFFRSPHPSRLARWYAQCLKFSLASRSAASFAPAKMPAAGLTVWSLFPQGTRYFKPSRKQFMLNFVVDDLEDALAQVVQAGGKPVGRIRDYSYGRFGWFMDPEGNKVELWEPRRRRAARPRAKPVQRRTK